jgi:hypothetical protein
LTKKIMALLIAVLMIGTLASASTMVKSTKSTVTTVGSKETKTVMRKHFKRISKKKVKTTTIKSTTVTPKTVK